jgi:hypothetical protein
VRDEGLSAAKAVDALRRTILDGAIAGMCKDVIEGLVVAAKTSRARGHGFMLGAIGQLDLTSPHHLHFLPFTRRSGKVASSSKSYLYSTEHFNSPEQWTDIIST